MKLPNMPYGVPPVPRRTTVADLAGNLGGIDASMVGDPFGQFVLGSAGRSMAPTSQYEPQGNSIRRLLGLGELSFAPPPQQAQPQEQASPWGPNKSKQFYEFAANLDPNDPVDRQRARQWEQGRAREAHRMRMDYQLQAKNSPETQAWLRGMSPDNRRAWELMYRL